MLSLGTSSGGARCAHHGGNGEVDGLKVNFKNKYSQKGDKKRKSRECLHTNKACQDGHLRSSQFQSFILIGTAAAANAALIHHITAGSRASNQWHFLVGLLG